MNAKRTKFARLSATVKEEVVPVLIHDPNDPSASQYAYATFTATEEGDSVHGNQETIVSGEEVIIDEHGRAVTIQQLVDNNSVEEVETVEENDGTHTILHIVPSSPQSGGEHDSIETITGDDPNCSLSPNDPANPRSKTYYCPNCGNCYSAAGSLKLHMRACMKQREEVPPEQRKCHICNKVFNSVSYLKEHMMRHTGEGPKRCTRCYRKFADENKWKAHMESHKKQDKLEAEAQALGKKLGGKQIVVKEFTCSFCNQSFTVVFEEGQVKRRYACDECRDKYSNEEQLKQHKQMVGEKRDYNCERCGRKFVFEGFLQRHLPTCDGTIKRRRDMK